MLGEGIFSIFGAGLNAAINSGLADEQWGNQLKLMEIQNRYNEQMAKNNQQRNKDLWDYTNYENQKQHIKNAGLNPALMYGMGGGGGVSANGAQGQGVTQPTDRSVEMKLKQQGLGLQLASIASQVAVTVLVVEQLQVMMQVVECFMAGHKAAQAAAGSAKSADSDTRKRNTGGDTRQRNTG